MIGLWEFKVSLIRQFDCPYHKIWIRSKAIVVKRQNSEKAQLLTDFIGPSCATGNNLFSMFAVTIELNNESRR